MSIKLTEKRVRALLPSTRGQVFYWDTEQGNFGVRVTPGGVRSYIVEKRIHGRVRRHTIGKIDAFSLKEARELASEWLVEIAGGNDPLYTRKQAAKAIAKEEAMEKASALTLGEAFDQYLESKKTKLKPSTVRDYKRVRDTDLKIWKDRRLVDITGSMVAQRHKALFDRAQKQDARYCRKATGARANNVMRVLRAVFNHAAHILKESGIELENPVARLTATDSWNKVDRKSNYISETDLPVWYAAVLEQKSEKMRDYLLFVLFTGLRREEAARLLWRDVDLDQKTLKIIDPKNRRDHVLPLSDYLVELLERRHENRGAHNFVFPGRGDAAHLVTPWKVLQQIEADTGIKASVHDLRRTFSVIAAPLVPYPTLKRLLNHKNNEDVTLGYAIPDLEELREHMQRITDRILMVATRQKAKVVQLHG